MFRLHTSNDAARLADALGERLRTPTGNPLEPARVLVPQTGLKRWLQVHLAEQLGVIANVEFTPPAQFAWELLRAAQPDLPGKSPFDVDVLRWHLYALLGSALDGAALAPLREYLAAEGDPLRRYALAFELARAFERMQGYRRRKLLAWEHGAGEGDWQAELWRRLLARTGGVSRAARVEAWLAAHDPEFPPGEHTDKSAPPGLPKRFACFACANVSPDVLRMLAVAGLHCEVDFYLPLPSKEYLGDAPTSRKAIRERLREKEGGNPLITSLGGAAAEFVELLYGYEHVQPDEEVEAFDNEISRTTLLGRVRDDILGHVEPRADDRTALLDDSLQFHAGHTPLREVQTLHDSLLALFDDPRFDPPLQPRDVAVMMPDVAAYRPAIEAVFGAIPRGDDRRLPFNLGDGGTSLLHPVVTLFLGFMDAPASRWEATALLDVLAAPGVMRRFDLDADALEQLSRRVREAGVRWGENKAARADCGDYREFSWAFGIDRIVAGFACGDVEDALVGDTAPLAGVEGAGFAHLDAVLAITETWRRLRELSRQPHRPADWQALLNEILDSVYEPDPRDLAEARALERIRAVLAQLAEDCALADPDLELEWTELRAFLRARLDEPDPQQHLFTGGITFCGMVPLRVVPFRVICLLGMDEAAFPRRESSALDPLAADRRAGEALRGDRDLRADDRLLFLQLLAAARDVFYVSWIGRNAHTNEALPPSTVVAELLDAVKSGYLLAPTDEDARERRDALMPRVAPLHAFATSLFGADDTSPISYRHEWLPGARTRPRSVERPAPFVGTPLPAVDAGTDLTLDELKRFLGNPARAFLERGLDLRLPRDAEAEADLEPLDPDDGLLRWQLTTALLHGAEADVVRMRAQGRVPPGELGEAALSVARERAGLLQERIADFTKGAAPSAAIEGEVQLGDGTRIAGKVDDVYASGLVRASAGKLNGKRALEAWLDMLFATALADAPVACRLFWFDKKVCPRDLEMQAPEQARALLAGYVAALRDGLRAPPPLFPKAAWDALRRTRKKGEADLAEFSENLAKAADTDERYAGRKELDEAAVGVAWRGTDFADPGVQARMFEAAKDLLPQVAKEP